jgi:CHRD domain-containing protein
MHRLLIVKPMLIMAVLALTLSGAAASAEEFSARFSGFQEVGGVGAGQTGAILSDGTATLRLNLDKNADTMTYQLTYADLSAAVTQAHIHFGKRHVGGGIIVFLCTNLGNGPAGTPACPASGGTVTGSITAASVLAIAAQNVTAGDFNALEALLKSNTAYGNIHTAKFPAGEIRGQIHGSGNADK